MRVITGMHRSGTSLVARLFHEAGVDMGDPARFYTPDRWNPEGYFEQTDIHRVNMPLAHGPWGRLSYLRLPSERAVSRRAERRAERIQRTAEAYRHAVVKDPRFSITMTGWRRQTDAIDRVMICLRAPSAVAGSLRRRNRAGLRHSHYLWREHNRRALAAAAGLPVWFVLYENLVDPRRHDRELEGALRFFGVDTGEEQRRQLWTRSTRPDLDHHPDRGGGEHDRVAVQWSELLNRHRRQFTT